MEIGIKIRMSIYKQIERLQQLMCRLHYSNNISCHFVLQIGIYTKGTFQRTVNNLSTYYKSVRHFTTITFENHWRGRNMN